MNHLLMNHRWQRLGLLLSLVVAWVPQLIAQEQPVTQDKPVVQEQLTLEQCREMALKYNKELAASEQQARYARYTKLSTRALFLPNFSLTGTGLYSNIDGSFGLAGGNLPTFLPDASGQPLPNGGFAYFPGVEMNYKVGLVYMGGLTVEQPIYMGGKIRAAYQMARHGQLMAEANRTLTTTEVLLKTDRAYSLLVKAQEMQEVARSYYALLKELMKDVESAHRHGLKPKNDVLKVQVKLNEGELNIRKADNAMRLAQMNLCHCIGRPLLTEVRTTGRFPEVKVESQLQTSDISLRPEVEILDHQVEIARHQLKMTRSEALPQVGVMGNYSYMHGVEMDHRTLFNKPQLTAMLNVQIPLFHFGEQANKIKASKVQLQQVQLERDNLNEQMLLELAQAANNLDEAQLERDIAERSLRQADENRRVSRSQYEAGMESLSDHLEAQALWQQAWQTHVESRYQLYLKYIEYLKAAGRLKVSE